MRAGPSTTTDLIFTDEITDDLLALDANDGKILLQAPCRRSEFAGR